MLHAGRALSPPPAASEDDPPSDFGLDTSLTLDPPNAARGTKDAMYAHSQINRGRHPRVTRPEAEAHQVTA